MAPRKSVKISSPEKRIPTVPDKPRGTRRKNTPPLKVSSAITTSISVNNSGLVARAQLLKEPIAVRTKPPAIKRKKGQSKSTETELFNLKVTVKKEPEEETKSIAATDKKSITKNSEEINPVKRVVTRKRVADTIVSKQAVKRQKKAITPAVKPVPKEDTTEQSNVSKTNTLESQNEMVWIADIKNRKSPRKICSNDVKLPPKEELAETKSISKGDTSHSPSKLFTHTLRKRLPRGKQDTALENPLQSIPEISCLKSPQNLKSPKPQVERLTRGKQDTTVKIPLQSIPEISGLKSPQNLKSQKPQVEKLTRRKLDIALENPVQSIPEMSNLKSTQNLKSPKPQFANNKSGTPKSVTIKSSNIASNEVSRLKTLRSRSSKPSGIKSQAQKTEENISRGNNSAPVNSRQDSISSISSLSWTRDISSSSTTTCITVSSNDFICIDKKIPLVKLSNVDNEIHKYKSKNIATSNNANEVNEDSNSSSSDDDSTSSDSESSADSDSKMTPSECISVKVNSLNLSSPSRNSIVENKIEEHDPNKKDFGKAAEKLMQALNKIDMEFINWIHDSDFATSNLSKIKANLFTILNNEFCALRHCRHLQDISNPEKTKDPYVNVTNKPEVVENNIHNKKLQTIVIESNSIEMNKTECNKGDPKTNVSKLVNNNVSESNFEKVNVTDREAVATKVFKINEFSRGVTKCRDKDSPPRNDINVTRVKPTNETDQITRHKDESFPEDAFIKPSTSGCAVNSKVRRISEFNDSDSENEDFAADAYTNKLAQSAHDDDDALSLFAESITGIESSKMNASIMSTPAEKQFEEYVPKPKQNDFVSPPKPTYIYLPTKIPDHGKNGIVKTICEKQNADSTSIYKESNDVFSAYKETESFTESAECHQEVILKPSSIEVNSSYNVNKPCLLANLYTLKPKEHNVIFEGYCYFNLIHRCLSSKYGKSCRKSHDKPDERVIRNKLASLSNELLMKEYMLIRRDIHIMRSFGLCFLFECVKRKLTRVVVEIAYDFIMKGIKGLQLDEILKVASVEVALLHLNDLDLSVCEDILKLRVGDSLLCEVFMHVMTSTQNFSRFKSVFLSLTYFMVNNDRTFSLEVAEQILERVCILPFDETVVRALIQIMRLTRPEIFLNSMIVKFEKLIKQRRDIFDEYILVKSEINIEKLVRQVTEQRPGVVDQPVLPQLTEQPMLLQPLPMEQPVLLQPLAQPLNILSVEQPLNVRPEMREGVPPPPSPDTTHLDNMNNMTEDHVTPKITRTILGFRPAPKPQSAGVSPSSSNNEPPPFYRNWKNRSIFEKIPHNHFFSPRQTAPFARFSAAPNVHKRKRQFNHRLVTLGNSSIEYLPPGQDF